MSTPKLLIEKASAMHGDSRAVRRDRATAAMMSGAATALGALYAASDGFRYATLQAALELCHDAARVHPSRWELLRMNVRETFAAAVKYADTRDPQPAADPAPVLLACGCDAMAEAIRDPSLMYEATCQVHGRNMDEPCGLLLLDGERCQAQAIFRVVERLADGSTQTRCTQCNQASIFVV